MDNLEHLAARTGCSIGYVQTMAALGRMNELFDDAGDLTGTPTPAEALRQLERRRERWENEDTQR